MRLRIRRSICLSRNNFSRRPSGACGMDRGYALLVLMMMATILLVSLTVALPSVYLEGQREREEELIFRGNEYARAIALFHRQFNRFPRTVEDLLRTNGIRFLRHAYKRSEEHTSELQSLAYLVCRLLLEKKKKHLSEISHDPTFSAQSLLYPPHTQQPRHATLHSRATPDQGTVVLLPA